MFDPDTLTLIGTLHTVSSLFSFSSPQTTKTTKKWFDITTTKTTHHFVAILNGYQQLQVQVKVQVY